MTLNFEPISTAHHQYGADSVAVRKSSHATSSSSRRAPLQSHNPNIQLASDGITKNGYGKSGGNVFSGSRYMSSKGGTSSSATSSKSGSASASNKYSSNMFQRTSSSSSASNVASSSKAVSDEATVIIEEKRRKLNGEGYTLHRYLRGRMLGKGGFAKVYLCTALDTNKNYAIKIVPKANLVKARARQKLQAEIKIHRSLKHKHICEYKHFFEDKQNCYILLELCHNHSVNEMIKRRKRLTEPESALFMKQMLNAVQHLHDNLVIHRDLKLGNLFLDRNMNIKVGDFGLATQLDSEDEKRKTICGTPNYIAPEVINEDRKTRGHSFEVDVWSMGVILFTTVVGKPPYEAKDVKSTYKRILANEYAFPSHLDISDNAKDIIRSMLKSKPSDRPSLDELAAHPFITDASIPLSLPSSATHSAPEWKDNGFGQLVLASEVENYRAMSGLASTKKSCLPITNALRRHPLGQRDLNANSERIQPDRSTKRLGSGDASDVMPKQSSASSMKNLSSKSSQFQHRQPPHQPPKFSSAPALRVQKAPASTGFEVFDESGTANRYCDTKPAVSKATDGIEDDLAARMTTSLSIQQKDKPASVRSSVDAASQAASQVAATPSADSPYDMVSPHPPTNGDVATPSTAALAGSAAASSSKPVSSTEVDCAILQGMIDRVGNVLDASSRVKKSTVSLFDNVALAPLNHGCPSKWVNRYVDYTAKYGLGYLLSDGSSGVYFNDSTKTVLEAEGEAFVYVERKRIAGDGITASRKLDPVLATHTLSEYPEELQKKVTLLKHFRSYLVEQQKKSDNDQAIIHASDSSEGDGLVYLKKWVRTKHAIFFRLSDQTVQIVFYDHTEVLLTPDERHITYVDKQRNRNTYYLTEDLVANNGEISKRLKYTKEILQQLLDSHKR